jgi:phosphotransferase system HPr (HPr) family protein
MRDRGVGVTRTLELTVIDPLGIHARPASVLAIAVKRSGAKVRLHIENRIADGASVVQMLGLGARQGSNVTLEIEGDDDAVAAVESAFGKLFAPRT